MRHFLTRLTFILVLVSNSLGLGLWLGRSQPTSQENEFQKRIAKQQANIHRALGLKLTRGDEAWVLVGGPSRINWYVMKGAKGVANGEIALPFDIGCCAVELPNGKCLVSGLDWTTKVGSLLLLELDRNRMVGRIVANSELSKIAPDKLAYNHQERMLYLFDADSKSLFACEFDGELPLPVQADFRQILDASTCPELATRTLILRPNSGLFLDGVTLVDGKEEVVLVPTLEGEWTRERPVEEFLERKWKFGHPIGRFDGGPSKEELHLRRAALLEQAENRLAFVGDQLDAGSFQLLSRDDIQAFHNGFLSFYSSAFGSRIPNAVALTITVDRFKRDEFGIKIDEPDNTPTTVLMEPRFTEAFWDHYNSVDLPEIIERFRRLREDPSGAIADEIAQIVAEREFLSRYVQQGSESGRNKRILENLHRFNQGYPAMSRTIINAQENGTVMSVLTGHTRACDFMLFHPDGKRLITATPESGESVRVWDLATGRCIRAIPAGGIRDLALSPDGTMIATLGVSGRAITVWSLEGEELAKCLRPTRRNQGATAPASSLCFSPTGEELWVGEKSGILELRDWKTGEILREFRGHDSAIVALKILPRTQSLVSTGFDGSTRTLALTHWGLGDDAKPVSVPHPVGNSTGVLDPDAGAFTRLELSGAVQVRGFDLDALQPRELSKHTVSGSQPGPNIHQLSPDGKHIALGYGTGKVEVRNIESDELVATYQLHSGGIIALAFDPSGQILATSSLDRHILLVRPFAPSALTIPLGTQDFGPFKVRK